MNAFAAQGVGLGTRVVTPDVFAGAVLSGQVRTGPTCACTCTIRPCVASRCAAIARLQQNVAQLRIRAHDDDANKGWIVLAD